jgi:hypothetical protein
LLYTISPGSAIAAGRDAAGGGAREAGGAGGLPGNGLEQVAAGLPAGMIAVRAADVSCPGSAAGAGALVVSSVPAVSGEMLVFTCPVTVAPAVVGRPGGGIRPQLPRP